MSILKLRRRLAIGQSRGGDDRGVTLVELVTAMFLFGIIATLLITAVITFTRTFTKDRLATENTSISAIGMNELTRVIRSGTLLERSGDDLPPFVVAKAEELTLFAYIDTSSTAPEPVKIQFKVDATTRVLTETRWKAKPFAAGSSYWDFEATAYSTRTIARKIVVPATGAASLFTYYSINSTTLLEEKITTPTTGITAANLPKIAVVEVALTVQSDALGRAAPSTVVNRVGIPNLGISRLGAPAS